MDINVTISNDIIMEYLRSTNKYNLYELEDSFKKKWLSDDFKNFIIAMYEHIMRCRYNVNNLKDIRNDSILFFGSRDSIEEQNNLRAKFEQALILLGGLQQPDHSYSEEAAKQAEQIRKEDEQEFENLVTDIMKALGR